MLIRGGIVARIVFVVQSAIFLMAVYVVADVFADDECVRTGCGADERDEKVVVQKTPNKWIKFNPNL